jgi:epoxyqueuosine reductase
MSHQQIVDQIMNRVRDLGIDLCGIAAVSDLTSAPSFILAPQMPEIASGVGTRQSKLEVAPGEVSWPKDAKSVLVLAIAHPEDKPGPTWGRP